MSRVPPELMTEILTRLPPKSLVRLRCMSKSSQSEIDSPEFAELHLHRSIESGSHQVLRFKSSGQAQLFESLLSFSNKPPDDESLTLPVKNLPFVFCGTCHGLIALSFYDGVVVWNPNTRKHWFPPLPDIVYSRARHPPKVAFGLGYDSLSKDYKLVRIVPSMLSNRIGDYQVMVDSFKSNSWTLSFNTPYPLKLCFEGHYVFSYNALHFVATSEDGDSFIITALDLHTNKFRNLVEVPRREIGFSPPYFHRTVVLGGQLCVVLQMFDPEMIEVWVMKDYGGEEESWAKFFNISCNTFQDFVLLDYLESEKKLLLHRNSTGFTWIDLETGAEDQGVSQSPWQTATLLVGSIVSLCNGVGGSTTFQWRTTLTHSDCNLRISNAIDFLPFVLPHDNMAKLSNVSSVIQKSGVYDHLFLVV